MKQSTWNNKTEEKPTSTAYLPYTQTTYGRLSWMLAKYNIKSVAITPRKISSYMPPTKNAPGLRTPGIYKIPCECGKVHIGQSGRSIQLRIKEHERHIRLVQPEKSVVAEHSFNHDHMNIVLILITSSDYKTLNSSLQKPATWIISSEKPSKLRCIHITSTEMGDSTSANPGSLCCITSRKRDSHLV